MLRAIAALAKLAARGELRQAVRAVEAEILRKRFYVGGGGGVEHNLQLSF